jgi:hypothetical protein
MGTENLRVTRPVLCGELDQFLNPVMMLPQQRNKSRVLVLEIAIPGAADVSMLGRTK